jgi:hypothetical protein
MKEEVVVILRHCPGLLQILNLIEIFQMVEFGRMRKKVVVILMSAAISYAINSLLNLIEIC